MNGTRGQPGMGGFLFPMLWLVAGCTAQAAEHLEVAGDSPLLALATLDEARGQWSSAPFSGGPWIPMGRNGTVTIHHGLGRAPLSVQVYLSFTEDDRIFRQEGQEEIEEPRRFFPAAGDVANVLKASDELVVLRNNTRGEFFVRILLQ